MFCKKCKSLLVFKKKKLVCSTCGETWNGRIGFREPMKKEEGIHVLDEKDEHTGDSEVPIVCWNCGNVGVYSWMVQISRADEAPTRFYKCRKCRKVWRSSK